MSTNMDENSGSSNSNSTRVGSKCGRWNPTAQQVKVLTDLFASGLRSPTTEQIQMISSRLSTFGKIESKNVFYWFQNHKARERHHKKRRRSSTGGAGGGGGGDLCLKTSNKKETRIEREVKWEEEKDQREMETLQLFPLSSYNGWETEKIMTIRREWTTDIQFFDAEKNHRNIPTLDLRLSFL